MATRIARCIDDWVTIDPATGEFSGHAWSENVGWIRFRGDNSVQYGVTTSWPNGGAPGCIPASNNPAGADLNGDGIVTYGDLSLIASCFSPTLPVGACQVADTNCSGGVGIDDFQFVVPFLGQVADP